MTDQRRAACHVTLSPCCCTVDVEFDCFDGREFMSLSTTTAVQCVPCSSSSVLRRSPTSSSSTTSAATSTTTTTTSTTTTSPTRPDTSSYERRDIIAKGQTRFEGISKIAPPQPNIERLSERVINVLGMNPAPYTLNGTNCYVVGTGSKRLLIDTGNPPNEEIMGPRRGIVDAHLEFVKNLRQLMLEEQFEIELILITHLHFDHFGGVRGLLNEFGHDIPVGMLPAPRHHLSIFTMSEFEKRDMLDILETGPPPFVNGEWNRNNLSESDVPDWGANNDVSWDIAGRTKLDLQMDYHYMKRHYAFYKAWYIENETYNGTPINAKMLKHGEVIRTEGATLRVIFTPGHAENHASFVLDEEHSIFSGDNVLGYGTTQVCLDDFFLTKRAVLSLLFAVSRRLPRFPSSHLSPFFSSLQLSELYDYMASLEAMQRYKPVRLYPGHGGCIYDGTGLLDRYSAHRQSREDQVYEWLDLLRREKKGPVTSMDIARSLYVNTPPKRMKMAKENIERILLKLYRQGSTYCWKTKERKESGELPKYGYIHNMDLDLGWELKSNEEQSLVRYEKFVNVIFNAMGTDPFVSIMPKILEPEDILREGVDGENRGGAKL